MADILILEISLYMVKLECNSATENPTKNLISGSLRHWLPVRKNDVEFPIPRSVWFLISIGLPLHVGLSSMVVI